MKVAKKITFNGQTATLFTNGDIVWSGMHFPAGMGANASLLAALAK